MPTYKKENCPSVFSFHLLWFSLLGFLFFMGTYPPLSLAHRCIHETLDHNRLTSRYEKNGTLELEAQPLQDMSRLKIGGSQMSPTRSSRTPIRITTIVQALYDPTKYCTVKGQTRTTFLGSNMKCQDVDILTSEKREKLLREILPQALQFFQHAFRVDRNMSGIILDSNICGSELDVPSAYTTPPGALDTDYILFVTAGPIEGEATVAWAGACKYNQHGRPVVGIVNFSPSALGLPLPLMYFRKVATHELTHALGFTPYFVEKMFLRPHQRYIRTQNQRGKKTFLLTSPEVVRTSRRYFNCSTLEGMELEDGGGEGTQLAHWEKRLLLNELMVGMLNVGEVHLGVSEMTLAFFKDSGHYDVNYATASPETELQFGRGAGCTFITEKCNSSGGAVVHIFVLIESAHAHLID